MLQVLDVGFLPGERIGSYRVERELGPTGSAVLVAARHVVLPRRALIKIVHADFAASQAFAVQILREAYVLESIGHEGVPAIYESGRLSERRPWFAFEPVSGPTLEDVLAGGPRPVLEVAGLLRDLAEVLAHAHRRGVIHCGLRPDRILLTRERRFPLCIPDWSDAVPHDATYHMPRVTPPGPADYTAPELARHTDGMRSRIDDRSDMFALGVIAYRALTGVLPASSGPAWLNTHVRRPDAPHELAAIVDALIALERLDRPSATEVRAEIEAAFGEALELQQHAASRDERQLIEDGQTSLDDTTHAREDVLLFDSLRLRRPRWTPSTGLAESTEIEVEILDEERSGQ